MSNPISEGLGNSGSLHSIDFPAISFKRAGETVELPATTLTFRYITQKDKAELNKYLFNGVLAGLKELKESKVLTPQEYFTALLQTNKEYTAGYYTAESTFGVDFLNSVEGKIYQMCLMTGKTKQELSDLVEAHGEAQFVAMLTLITQESSDVGPPPA